ncbi:MAG: hypothetical protein AB7P37_14040 [Ramlibacter sp.]
MSRIHIVIHHRDADTTLSQAQLALACGADGVFLISHTGGDAALPTLGATLNDCWATVRSTRDETPSVGLCLLTYSPGQAMDAAAAAGVNALWVGASGIASSGIDDTGRALCEAMRRHPQIAVFAGVAFKYQGEEPDPAAAARVATSLGMIPTTSGAATGSAPALAKIEAMSRAVGGRLAVASGMTIDNVADFAPLVSDILVSTGVSRDEYTLNEGKLRAFVARAR